MAAWLGKRVILNNRVSSFGDKKNFSITHLSTQSLVRNFDELNSLLRNLNMTLSVIGVSETWLTDCTTALVNITGYNFVSNHRKSKTDSGVRIYFLNGLEYRLLEECKFSDPDVIKSLFLKIIVPHGKNSIAGCVHRPTNHYSVYW